MFRKEKERELHQWSWIFMALWISRFIYSAIGLEVWNFLEVKPAGFENVPNVRFGGKKKKKQQQSLKTKVNF